MLERTSVTRMKDSFHKLATVAAIAFFALALVWMFAPAQSLSIWGIEFSVGAGVVSRRCAAVYAGFGVMFFLARNSVPSSGRRALVMGVVVACLILALLGLFELAAGHVHLGILPAALIEIALSVSLLCVDRSPPT